jgi:hypothetical protein
MIPVHSVFLAPCEAAHPVVKIFWFRRGRWYQRRLRLGSLATPGLALHVQFSVVQDHYVHFQVVLDHGLSVN